MKETINAELSQYYSDFFKERKPMSQFTLAIDLWDRVVDAVDFEAQVELMMKGGIVKFYKKNTGDKFLEKTFDKSVVLNKFGDIEECLVCGMLLNMVMNEEMCGRRKKAVKKSKSKSTKTAKTAKTISSSKSKTSKTTKQVVSVKKSKTKESAHRKARHQKRKDAGVIQR